MAKAAAAALSLRPEDVLVCSTGVIGQQLPVERIENCIETLAGGLSKAGHEAAREAIMTTDTAYKECAVETVIAGKTVRIGTMAKGSGMIHINLGTMLGFITTDCAITAAMLDKALRESAEGTYNCVSVDGDTSTNDTLLVLANGKAGIREIVSEGADYDAFLAALNAVNTVMAKKIAGDGEGAEHVIECHVTGAASVTDARVLAKSVVSSNLVKAAFFGKDANWGRVLCALGYAGVAFNPDTASVSFENKRGSIDLYRMGVPLDFDDGKAKEILSEAETRIEVALGDLSARGTGGNAEGFAWGCDLTYEYVKINGDYRT
jgi:glutamate N-acetyltransferase/amino-acid N-acetyltransferase